MTLDEAIKHVEEVAEKNERRAESVRNRPISSADFYHEEESCSKCAEEHRQLAEWLKELKAYKEQDSDAISRQAAIRAIEALQLPIMREASTCYQYKFSGMSEAKEAMENLPSVTPQQRTGRWIKQNYGWNWQCSECGFVTPPSAKEIFTFCPKCGCKMEVEE